MGGLGLSTPFFTWVAGEAYKELNFCVVLANRAESMQNGGQEIAEKLRGGFSDVMTFLNFR